MPISLSKSLPRIFCSVCHCEMQTTCSLLPVNAHLCSLMSMLLCWIPMFLILTPFHTTPLLPNTLSIQITNSRSLSLFNRGPGSLANPVTSHIWWTAFLCVIWKSFWEIVASWKLSIRTSRTLSSSTAWGFSGWPVGGRLVGPARRIPPSSTQSCYTDSFFHPLTPANISVYWSLLAGCKSVCWQYQSRSPFKFIPKTLCNWPLLTHRVLRSVGSSRGCSRRRSYWGWGGLLIGIRGWLFGAVLVTRSWRPGLSVIIEVGPDRACSYRWITGWWFGSVRWLFDCVLRRWAQRQLPGEFTKTAWTWTLASPSRSSKSSSNMYYTHAQNTACQESANPKY